MNPGPGLRSSRGMFLAAMVRSMIVVHTSLYTGIQNRGEGPSDSSTNTLKSHGRDETDPHDQSL